MIGQKHIFAVALLAAALTLACASQASGAVAGPDSPPLGQALFTDDDLLLFEVTSGGMELSDGLSGYSSRGGIYLPLGELTRLLDLAITVDPATQRAEGWVLSEDRSFSVDLKKHEANIGGKELSLASTDAILYGGDIYVRSDLWEKILPLALKVSKSDLSIEVVPREKFPFQEKLERQRRREGLGQGGPAAEKVLHIPSSYSLFTPPSADLTLDGAIASQKPRVSGTWELRLGGDLAYTGAQLFVGSDQEGKPSSVRALMERKDPDGLDAGFYGATRSDAGDVYTPSLAIGSVSQGGRGISTTSVPLDTASVFSTTDLRGELPLGYEVELYVNEILRGSQSEPVRGNYEFLSVPLSYGANVIRLVFYGPRGERREEVSRVNVGSGQLKAGEFDYSFGAVQNQVPLIDISDAGKPIPGTFGIGSLRVAGSAAFGLSDDFTLTGGFAEYTPNTTFDHRARSLVTGGLLTSLFGLALDFDAAGDSHKGMAFAAGAGGSLFDVSLVARHTEYSGSFADEVQIRDLSSDVPLRRASDFTADWSLPLPLIDLTLPISLHGQESEFVDGSQRLLGEAHASFAIDRYLLSGSWQYEQLASSGKPIMRTSSGTFDASAFVWRNWQVRGEAVFNGEPKTHIDSASLVVNGNVSDNASLQFGVTHAFAMSPPETIIGGESMGCTPGSGSITGGCPPNIGSTAINASTTWHLARFDLSVNGSYTPESRDYQFGVQLALGALFDPVQNTYVAARPGAAAGGTAILDVFADKNGNGIHDADEAGVAGVKAQGSNWPAESDTSGEALVGGLGDAPHARIHVDQETISDPYLIAPADVIEVVPHPGRVLVVPYPLKSMGEVQLSIHFTRDGETPRGLSALDVQAVSADGTIAAEGRTEYDGTLVLDRLPAGTYSIRIEPDQAKRLKLAFAAPVSISIPAKGGYIGQVEANVQIAP